VEAGAEEESEPGDLKPAGMYVIRRAALGGIGKTSYQDLKESLVRRVAAEGRPVVPHVVRSAGQRVRELSVYLAAQETVLRSAWDLGVVPVGYRWQGQSCVHRSARVASESRLVGWVMVGARSSVAPGAVLVGPAVLGDDCSVGEGSVISRSVFWEQAGVGRAARVDLSVCTTGSFIPDRAWVYSECRIAGARPRVGART
jgi:NDP-sugar pyrophosphorylase family protein